MHPTLSCALFYDTDGTPIATALFFLRNVSVKMHNTNQTTTATLLFRSCLGGWLFHIPPSAGTTKLTLQSLEISRRIQRMSSCRCPLQSSQWTLQNKYPWKSLHKNRTPRRDCLSPGRVQPHGVASVIPSFPDHLPSPWCAVTYLFQAV